MTAPSSQPHDPAHTAPEDYSAFFEEYFAYIRNLVAKCGIRPENVDDAASEVLLKFFEKDALAWYDPDKLHIHTGPGGKTRVTTASFKTLLRRFVMLYSRTERDKQMLRDRREGNSLVTESSEGPVPAAITRAITQSGCEDAVVACLDAQRGLATAREHLVAVVWKEGTPPRLMTEVFDAVADAAQASDGPPTRSAVAKRLNCSVGTAGQAMRAMRVALTEGGEGVQEG